MVKIENMCVDCAIPNCAFCSLRRVPVCHCDICGEQIDSDETYNIDDYELCEDCAAKYCIDNLFSEQLTEDYFIKFSCMTKIEYKEENLSLSDESCNDLIDYLIKVGIL